MTAFDSETIVEILRETYLRVTCGHLHGSVASELANDVMRAFLADGRETVDLTMIDDLALAEEVRQREIAFQNGVAELSRRSATRGHPDWSERGAAERIAQKRKDVFQYEPDSRIGELPPPLFRMGYEWAVLSIVTILELILKNPSEDIVLSQDFQDVGRGLYKPVGVPTPSDPRRRAARDLIDEIELFGKQKLRGMFYSWERKSDYKPDDDAALAERIKEKREGLTGALFR